MTRTRQGKIDREELAALVADGWTTAEIAAHYDAHVDSISKIRRHLGISADQRAPRIDREEVARLVDNGWTNRAIAKELHVHPDSISRIRHELGITNPHRPRPMTPERLTRIREMIEDGWSHAEIHRTEGADKETLARYFPGTAWTPQQRAEYVSTLRSINTHFNKRPARYDRRKYEAA